MIDDRVTLATSLPRRRTDVRRTADAAAGYEQVRLPASVPELDAGHVVAASSSSGRENELKETFFWTAVRVMSCVS
jgi:hypothetical protein